MQAPPGGEQLELGAVGHHPFGGIEHVDHVVTVGGDESDADAGTAVQILGTGFGR